MITKICCKCCPELHKYIKQLESESASVTISPWLVLHLDDSSVFAVCEYDSEGGNNLLTGCYLEGNAGYTELTPTDFYNFIKNKNNGINKPGRVRCKGSLTLRNTIEEWIKQSNIYRKRYGNSCNYIYSFYLNADGFWVFDLCNEPTVPLVDVHCFINFWKEILPLRNNSIKPKQIEKDSRIAFSLSDPKINLDRLPDGIGNKRILEVCRNGYIVLNEHFWELVPIPDLTLYERQVEVLPFNEFVQEATIRYLQGTAAKSSEKVIIINDNKESRETPVSTIKGEIKLSNLKPLKIVI